MKTILTLIASFIMTTGAAASIEAAHAPALTAPHASAPQKALTSTHKPEGTPKPYIMSGFYDTVYGMMQIVGFSNTVYFADDDATVYIGSFFPRDFATEQLWHKGKIVDNKIVFDSKEIACTLREDYGMYKLHFGEYYEEDRSWKIKDLELNYEREDGHIYMEDSEAVPQRHIGLCIVDLEGTAIPIFETRCLNLEYFDKSLEFTTVPETAVVTDYVHFGSSSFDSTIAQLGRVAVDGDDYYFDSLLPEMGNAWLKGTREGNTIKLVSDQYLGNSVGYYLYYDGVERTKYNELYGNYDISPTELEIEVKADGSLVVENNQKCFPGAYTAGGYLYYYVKNLRLEPYAGDVLMTPSAPGEIDLFDQYNDFGVFCLVFRLENLTKDGRFLNPEHLSYRIYIDDEPYTFRKAEYPNIDHDMALVPYGYTDNRGDEYADIICRDINWNVVNLREDMFEKVGVQAVYTVDGETAESPILYVNLIGRKWTEYPDGIVNLTNEAPKDQLNAIFDIYGRRATRNDGLRIENGKVVLR